MNDKNVRLMQGNEACVEGAIAAGMRFFAGYPITPSTEIAEGSSEKLPQVGGKFVQMEDEIGSIAAVIGASLTGLKSMTATSGPGMSLKLENIGYAAIAEIPCVIVNVQRGGPSTGLPTSPAQGDIMQARWGTHGDHPTIALYPSSVSEIYQITIEAFNMAEKYRMPVILLMDEVIGHMRERIELPERSALQIIDRKKPSVGPEQYLPYQADADGGVPEMASFGDGYRFHVTGLVHDETGFPSNSSEVTARLINRLMKKIENNLDDILRYEEENTGDADTLLLAYGCTARSAKSAMDAAREEGMKVGLFRPITIWPFPEQKVRELAQRVKRIIVPEMNLGQYILEVQRVAGGSCTVEGVNRADGEIITPEDILDKIKGVF
ncbi:MAG: 2-oxoglutarate/2-oxoacid ferredoxin oxidoreductase, alpha subunit [Firmicutes bacterium]|nr:2-oxoglutarate/2-oxoacid ferredoxin oxidoreductase, alpha subunit [Bacillota bacterium]MDI6706372.1 2-oxoacid:acceptor oxidoreductase subunit alpha [Bacillota bacterium]